FSETTEYLIDEGSRAAVAFGVFGIPETFFIDPEGTVVGRIIGPTDALTLGGAIDAIGRGEDPGEKRLGNTRSGPGDARSTLVDHLDIDLGEMHRVEGVTPGAEEEPGGEHRDEQPLDPYHAVVHDPVSHPSVR